MLFSIVAWRIAFVAHYCGQVYILSKIGQSFAALLFIGARNRLAFLFSSFARRMYERMARTSFSSIPSLSLHQMKRENALALNTTVNITVARAEKPSREHIASPRIIVNSIV